MAARLKGVAIAGLVGGVLAIAFAFVPLANYALCCLVAIAAGALGSFIHVRSSRTKVGLGGGAVTGLLTGVVIFIELCFVYFPLSQIVGFFAIKALTSSHTFEDQLQMYTSFQFWAGSIVSLLVGCLYFFGFSTVGGLIGSLGGGGADVDPGDLDLDLGAG